MTTIIAFDTATERTVVGASVDGERAFEWSSEPDRGSRPAHSAELLPAIERAVGAVGGWEAIDLIGVGLGPGTYTGLRISVATARGFALAGLGPVVGVSSLEAMAHSIAGRTPDAVAVPVLDAKRNEVFFGAWDAEGKELHPASVGPAGDVLALASRLPVRSVIAGPGAVRFRSDLLSDGLEQAVEDDPAHRLEGFALCEVTARMAGQDRQERLEPIYLREPDAARWTGLTVDQQD